MMPCFGCFAGICGGDPTAKKKKALKKAEGMVRELVRAKDVAPILVRLAWHDSGTYDKANEEAGKEFPNLGGATGSIISPPEIEADVNRGLSKAVDSYLRPIKEAVGDDISWADLIQLASATGIEEAGGPKIDMKYGRVDGDPTEPQDPPFGLPNPCLEGGEDPVDHLRYVFNKYDMGDKDIVALSGAHTLGRAFHDRSGAVEEDSTGKKCTMYTKRGCPQMGHSMTAGGRSWTKEWTRFDNTYFSDMGKDPECVVFPTDNCLKTTPEFTVYFDLFAKDRDAFFEAYKVSHKKLSELGCKWDPPEGIKI